MTDQDVNTAEQVNKKETGFYVSFRVQAHTDNAQFTVKVSAPASEGGVTLVEESVRVTPYVQGWNTYEYNRKKNLSFLQRVRDSWYDDWMSVIYVGVGVLAALTCLTIMTTMFFAFD